MVAWLFAALPILMLMIAMNIFRWGTEKAGLLSLLTALFTAYFSAKASVYLLAFEMVKGAWNALSILIVIFPAIMLYEILLDVNAFQTIKKFVVDATGDQLIQILIFSWLFPSFLQGITGFGVPVAVCAPLLVAIGIRPLWAVIITLLGHAWANTFGTLALAWDALIRQTGIPEVAQTALYTSLMLWAFNVACCCLICFLYGGKKAIKHIGPFLLFISVIHGVGQVVLSQINTTIAVFIPTTAALIATAVMIKLGWYAKPWSMPSKLMGGVVKETNEEQKVSIMGAFSPFLLLAALSAVVLLVKPINKALAFLSFGFPTPYTITGNGFENNAMAIYNPIQFLTHAGFILIVTAIVTYCIYFYKKALTPRSLPKIWNNMLKKTIPASLGILTLVMMSQTLKGSGQIYVLAHGVAFVAGDLYGFVSPVIGLLGAFITSSNTSSNILFGEFQYTTARLLSVSGPMMLVAQTVGGAIGTIIGPSTILLGVTTVGCKGEEGLVLRKTLPIALVAVTLVGLIVVLVTN